MDCSFDARLGITEAEAQLKLYMDFLLYNGSGPLTPLFFKDQLLNFLSSCSTNRLCALHPGSKVQQCNKVGLCHKFPFSPFLDCDLVTFKCSSEIPLCLCSCTPPWLQIKALAADSRTWVHVLILSPPPPPPLPQFPIHLVEPCL